MQELHVLIDDIRNLNTDIVCRNANAGKETLRNCVVTHLYLDHDLGEKETGYDVLFWALQHGYLHFVKFIQLVTSNPVGKHNMGNLLVGNKWETKDGTNFRKRK